MFVDQSIPRVTSAFHHHAGVMVRHMCSYTSATRSVIDTKRQDSVMDMRRPDSVMDVRRPGSVLDMGRQGSVINMRRQGSVINMRRQGSVINMKRQGSVRISRCAETISQLIYFLVVWALMYTYIPGTETEVHIRWS